MFGSSLCSDAEVISLSNITVEKDIVAPDNNLVLEVICGVVVAVCAVGALGVQVYDKIKVDNRTSFEIPTKISTVTLDNGLYSCKFGTDKGTKLKSTWDDGTFVSSSGTVEAYSEIPSPAEYESIWGLDKTFGTVTLGQHIDTIHSNSSEKQLRLTHLFTGEESVGVRFDIDGKSGTGSNHSESGKVKHLNKY